ncbi:hypothetical protein A2696_02280 [Candidatus Curtissbacteria bacterium RIFCSPHIGHO2_01_FULL_41_13]|uniref:Antitoxin n=1 Tax=Candidatus Curtissbacteria bacterium RIFCSPHIGHO2_01_FULL_41_13 TaxID=1797745 RepID=A0A1F5FZQ2_9BACT|nr:MAG: hypothetical protein A2696_02280 [Candidatus Curtissbacteria bacterium RIFCSPHIGHO2_01_FULL_41_13]
MEKSRSAYIDKFVYKFYNKFVMQLPIIKSISDIRKNATKLFEDVNKRDEVIVVTKNNDQLSVVISPKYFKSIVEENETLWEELEMTRSKRATKGERSYKLEDVISGKV